MAEAMIGSAFLNALVKILLDKLASDEAITNLFKGKKPIIDLLDELKSRLLSIDRLLDDAEEKQIDHSKTRKWLDELKAVIYEADELMGMVNTKALVLKVEGESGSNVSMALMKLIPPSFNDFERAIKHEMEENILPKLNLLVGRKDELGLKVAVGPHHRCHNTLLAPLVQQSDVRGRNSVKETIVNSLIYDVGGHNTSVIAIVGIGGIGKTTLAQLIYDDPRVKEHFNELKAWITVSNHFDVMKIMKLIFLKLTSQRDCGIEEPKELQFRLKEVLTRKKFLFVFDDVWNEDPRKWNALKSTFMCAAHGSKIIVTTRSIDIANIFMTGAQQPHYLSELSEEDCWQIFTKQAFEDGEDLSAHSDLERIGKEIVKKCRGLPLAVNYIGVALHSERNPRKWENVLESNTWELYDKRKIHILPTLWLSYRCLPSYLKPCFAFCAVFPKDHLFNKKEMVLLWMAEGFLQPENGTKMEEVGENYFDGLVSRLLLQRSRENESNFIMHDLVHDLAMYASSKFCFCSDARRSSSNLTSKTRYFSHDMAVEGLGKFEDLSKSKRLHTFIALNAFSRKINYMKLVENLVTSNKYLRVLSISEAYFVEELPGSIGNLQHLRYLNLSWSRVAKLPDSFCIMYNLETLVLSNCPNLSYLPPKMGNLIKLLHLDIRNSPLKEMPNHMCKLLALESLSDFVLGKNGGSNVKELGELQGLHGRLRISGLQNVKNVKDVLEAKLSTKNLCELALEWKGSTNDTCHEKSVLDALQPHTNLSKITISGYQGTRFPQWVGNHHSLSKILSMHLKSCQNCFCLPPLGRLPLLRELKISEFPCLETIGGHAFYDSDSPFRSLQTLHLENMPELREWSFLEGENQAFPCLKTLHLSDCPKITGNLPYSHTMETLHILRCRSLNFPTNHRYSSLKSLCIQVSCDSMKSLPLDNFPKLNVLQLSHLRYCLELSGNLPNLIEIISIESCENLEFPKNHRYASLKKLYINYCGSLKSFPLDYFPSLDEFSSVACSVESIIFSEEPRRLTLESLGYLKLSSWENLSSFPKGGLPCPNMKELHLSCLELKSLPEQMNSLLPTLKVLTLEYCHEIESFPEGGLPLTLETLEIQECRGLMAKHRQWDLQNLTSLASLSISGCEDESLKSFPEGLPLTSLTSLVIQNFPFLENINSDAFRKLNKLQVCYCNKLRCLPEERTFLKFLFDVRILECPLLKERYTMIKHKVKLSCVPHVYIDCNKLR